MNPFDMKTVITGYLVSNAICAAVAAALWIQNRRRFEGLGFWLADFVMQFAALILVVLRGAIPDLVSMTGSNALVVGGTMLLLAGLERFWGRRRSQVHNIILLAAFIFTHAYFVFYPNLGYRNIIFSLGLLAVCSQCAWFLLRGVDVEARRHSYSTGILFAAYCLVSIFRILVDLVIPVGDDFLHSNAYDTLAVMLYQMLSIGLIFTLFLMVNRRLVVDLELDIEARKQTEGALRLSDEKFQKAFHSSPDSILITRVDDGRIVETNEGFTRITGYSREEALGKSTITLNLWADPRNRDSFVAILRENGNVRGVEYDFRVKSGGILRATMSAETIQLGGEAHAISIIHDITERKQMEDTLRASEERYQAFISQSFEAIYRTEFDHPIDTSLPVETQIDLIYENAYMAECNQTLADMYNLPSAEVVGMRLVDAHGGKDNPVNRATFRKFIQNGYKSFNDETMEYDGAGSPVWFLSNTIGIVESGFLVRMWGTSINITERRQSDETYKIRLKLFELSPSSSLEELMQKALDDICGIANSPIGFYHFVEEDQKTISLQAWSTRTLKEFCKAEGVGLHYPIDQAGVWTDCVVQRKPVIHNDYPSLPHRKGLPPGHAEVIRELVVPILRQGRVVSILGVGNKPSEYNDKDVRFVSYIADVVWEIVERKRAEDKLRQLSRAVEQSPASIVITDTKGKIEYVNPRFTQVTGYSSAEVIGRNPRILKSGATPKETHSDLWRTVTAGRDWRGEFVNRKKNGDIYYELASISPILNTHGSITHYVAVKENITDRKESQLLLRATNEQLEEKIKENLKLQESLREQAIRDPLTGLYNRRYLYETMGRELAHAEREKYPVGFMMMDIDRFKQVNDTYGHAAGDRVLVALARLLQSHIRQGDIACRYGGEEFLVIMLEVCEMDAKRRAEEIRQSFHTLETDFDGAKLSATISIGIALYPRDGGNSEAVIRAADAALYQAKQAGRDCVRVWEAQPDN